jgi:hypothetical protein
MADRYPLILNQTNSKLEELKSGDNLNLSGNGIYDGTGSGSNGQVLTKTASGVKWQTESDPVFTASPAFSISTANVTSWNDAYTAAYGSINFHDDVTISSPSNGQVLKYDNGQWKNLAETDPVFTASPASGITSTNITNWNTAYGWGNHATQGYLGSTEITNPSNDQTLKYLNGKWINSTTSGLSVRQVSQASVSVTANSSSYVELNPVAPCYALLKIEVSEPAWVVLYISAQARTNDASRNQFTDPTPGSGVIAEVITTSTNQIQTITPGTIGWNNEDGANASKVYVKVFNTNLSQSKTITVKITYVKLEATA